MKSLFTSALTSLRVQRLASAFGVRKPVGQPRGAEGMQPIQTPVEPQARLIAMAVRAGLGVLGNALHLGRDRLGGCLFPSLQGAFTEPRSTQRLIGLAGPFVGQQLDMMQVRRQCAQVRSIWHGRADFPRKRCARRVLTLRTAHLFDHMIGRFQPQRGHILHLPPFDCLPRNRTQVILALLAVHRSVGLHLVGRLVPLQGVAAMSRLPTRFAAAAGSAGIWPPLQSIPGGRFATIVAVFRQLCSQLRHLPLQVVHSRLQVRDDLIAFFQVGFERGDLFLFGHVPILSWLTRGT
jgi:hypothetical protein